MKQVAIANEKQIVAGINKAFNKMESAKKGYVYSVIELGEKLNEAKKLVPFGEWSNWLNTNSEFAFEGRQAQKFMRIAENKMLVLEYFKGEESVNSLTKAISDATPEQLAKVEELRQQEEANRAAKAAELEAKKAAIKTKEPEIIEGEFVEVKNAFEDKPLYERPEESPLDMLNEVIDTLQNDNKELLKEIESVTKILVSNDQVTAAIAEVKKIRELNRVLNERLYGMQNECNVAKQQAKMWKAKYDRLAKETGRE